MAISSARGGASFLLLVAAAAAAALAGCSTTGKTDPNVPTLFTVDVGYENLDQAYQAQAFFPNALAVNVGDRVAFTSRTHEPHTVTFNAPSPAPDPFVAGPDHGLAANPVVFLPSPASGPLDLTAAADRTASFDGTGFVSSGFLGKPGDTFTVTFTREGTWVGVCLFHAPEMTVTILVNPKGTPRLMADAAYRSAAAAQVKDSQAKAADILDGLRVPGPTQNADGSRSYVVWAGAGNRKDGIDYVRFLGGEQLSVTAGDSVTFDVSRNGAGTRHTVTFPAGADDPHLFTDQPRTDGPPTVLLNPRVLMPAPLPPGPFDGKRFTSSGLLLTGGPTAQTWTVTFTQPGTFPYRCLFHDSEGMTGTIIVRPRTPPGPPGAASGLAAAP